MSDAIKILLGFIILMWIGTSFQKWEYEARGIKEPPPPPIYREGVSALELARKRAVPQEIVKACGAAEEKGIRDQFCEELSNEK